MSENQNFPAPTQTASAPLAFVQPSALIAVLGLAGGVVGLWEGWIIAAMLSGVGGAIALIRYATVRVKKHEQSMSLPPALDALQQSLGSLQLEPALRPHAERAQDQLRRLQDGLKQAREALDRKLSPGELAYSRFAGGFADAAGSVFAALQTAADRIKQASLMSGGTGDGAAQMLAQAGQSLDESEKALQALIAAIGSIAAMKTESSQVELSTAIEELKSIAARADRLSLKQGDKNE